MRSVWPSHSARLRVFPYCFCRKLESHSETDGLVSAAQFAGQAGEEPCASQRPQGGWTSGAGSQGPRLIASAAHTPGRLVWRWGSRCAAPGRCVGNGAPVLSGSRTGCRARQSHSRSPFCWWRSASPRRPPWGGESANALGPWQTRTPQVHLATSSSNSAPDAGQAPRGEQCPATNW